MYSRVGVLNPRSALSGAKFLAKKASKRRESLLDVGHASLTRQNMTKCSSCIQEIFKTPDAVCYVMLCRTLHSPNYLQI